MKLYVVTGSILTALVLMASCSTSSSTPPTGNTPAGVVSPPPEGEAESTLPSNDLDPDVPADAAKIKHMLIAQGYTAVKIDQYGSVDVGVPACPHLMGGNRGDVKNGRLRLLFTHDGIEFLDVDRPPTRQQLDDYGLCPLTDQT